MLTLKELSAKLSIAVGTLRSWTLKPVSGQPYNPRNINYTALRQGLNRYYSDEQLEKLLGFSIEQLEITKGERSSKEYTEIGDIAVGTTVMLHNYSLQTEMTFVGPYQADLPETLVTETLYIFNCAKGGYRCYTEEELSKPNIKLQLV